MLVHAANTGVFCHKCKVLSMKELYYDFVVLIEAKGDLSLSDSTLGLTLVAVVVVEIWVRAFKENSVPGQSPNILSRTLC